MPYDCPVDQHACMSPSQHYRADTYAAEMCRHSWLLKSNAPPLPDQLPEIPAISQNDLEQMRLISWLQ